MDTIKRLFIALIIFALTSCHIESGETERLRVENDSLRLAKLEVEQQVDAYLQAINTIQENIERIKLMENTISVEPIGENADNSISKLNEDIKYLNELLQSNRKELDRLRQQLKSSNLKIGELEKTIQTLTSRLDAETKKVAALERELAEKNKIIVEMTDTISSQSQQIENLTIANEAQQQVIADKNSEIAAAWYVFGTKKELKEQGILNTSGFSKKVLDGDFNKDYFVKIDARTTSSIPLYATHAKILTTHPKSSYTLEKENDRFVLVITDAQSFWSVSRYLVVEVD